MGNSLGTIAIMCDRLLIVNILKWVRKSKKLELLTTSKASQSVIVCIFVNPAFSFLCLSPSACWESLRVLHYPQREWTSVKTRWARGRSGNVSVYYNSKCLLVSVFLYNWLTLLIDNTELCRILLKKESNKGFLYPPEECVCRDPALCLYFHIFSILLCLGLNSLIMEQGNWLLSLIPRLSKTDDKSGILRRLVSIS